MNDFHYNLKFKTFTSLYLTFIGIFILYSLNTIGFLPKYLMWPIILYCVYFTSVFILTFLNRKLKYISIDKESLKIYIGSLWARKELHFEWNSFKSASVSTQKIQKNMVRSMWGNYYLTNERKILALEFDEKSKKNLVEILSVTRSRDVLNSTIEVNTDSRELIITEEPKGGFDLLLKGIIEHIDR